MRVHKKVLSHNTGTWILCAFEDCERPGFEVNHYTTNEGYEPFGMPDGTVEYRPKLLKYIFCSEGHRQLWIDCIGPDGLQGHLRSGKKSSSRLL
jgi:hypothetical protein